VGNIWAKHLHIVLDKLLEKISFSAPDQGGTTYKVDAKHVRQTIGDLAKNTDLSKFIL
jgi:ATP-dependent HslUV protease ATP-binding subunit HslU